LGFIAADSLDIFMVVYIPRFLAQEVPNKRQWNYIVLSKIPAYKGIVRELGRTQQSVFQLATLEWKFLSAWQRNTVKAES
jgi:hypothetical protein